MTGPAGEGDGDRLVEFLEVMRTLRSECAWKRSRTHRSLARHLLEECHEVLEALDTGEETGDWDHLREELGDLLLQIWFHAVIAEERGEFTLDDVAAGITEKMVRRNPHVFPPEGGDRVEAGDDPASIDELWQSVKDAEKRRSGPLEGVPRELPALLLADKVLARLERERPGGVGLPVPDDPGTGGDSDVGDRLLALVAEARTADVDPEQALRDAVRRLVG